MGEPLKIGGKAERYSRVEDKQAFDQTMDEAHLGAQHTDGLSSQRGRTTIKYKDGKRIVVRQHGEVLEPDEVSAAGKKFSVYDMLEQGGRIEHA
jgi:hypothetical protein